MINKNGGAMFQKVTEFGDNLSFYSNIAKRRFRQNFAGSNLCSNFVSEMIQQALLDAFSY